MKTLHLSDQEIQRFVFDFDEFGQENMVHIQTCAICKNKAKSYQNISRSIYNETVSVFDFNLTDLVMDHLPQSEEHLRGINIFIYFLLILSFAVISFATYYSLDLLSSLLNQISVFKYCFSLSIVGLIMIFLLWDIYNTFNQRIKMIDSI